MHENEAGANGSPDAARLSALALDLVGTPSPTGDTLDVARLYGRRLEEIGMDVELVDTFPSTPTVVGRLRGDGPGPTIVLNGHLDTVPIGHEPAHIQDGVLYGRGAADMKGALACAAEAVRVLRGSGSFAGEVVIVATGLHEAPHGRCEDLVDLLRNGGFQADAAIVGEGGGDTVPVAHMGQATVEIEIRREGLSTHELRTPPGTPHPLLTAARVVEAIRRRAEELAERTHPWVGSESYFVGELHGGDFFNRHPTTCRIVGTRRWAPVHSFEEVEAEYRALLEPIAAESGCAIDLDLRVTRHAYELDPEHPLLDALRASYLEVTGTELERVGNKLVADGSVFQREAGIPAVYHGPMGTGAHGDVESMPLSELMRATQVYVVLLRRLLRDDAEFPRVASVEPAA